jgi:hypothetical protein
MYCVYVLWDYGVAILLQRLRRALRGWDWIVVLMLALIIGSKTSEAAVLLESVA